MATNNNGINTEEEEKKINPTENYDKVTSNPVDPTKHTTAAKLDGFSYNPFKATGVAEQTESLAQKYLGMNYTDFTKGTDYQSLAKRYSDSGRKAMDDTMGQLAARTGGLASSYATVAGQQTYNDYMTRLEDAARALYDSQRAEARDNYDLAQGMYDRQLSQYNTDKGFAYGQYRDNVTDAQWMDNAEYGEYMDAVAGAQWKDSAITGQNNIDWEHDFRESESERDQGNIDREWNYKTANDEEQKLHNAIYYNPDLYPDYAAYKAANPNTTMTEATFNQIQSTAKGAYEEDNKEGVQKSAQEQIKTILENNGGNVDELPPDLVDNSGWDTLTISALAGSYADDNNTAKATAAFDKMNELISSGLTVDDILAEYPDLIADSGYSESYWRNIDAQSYSPANLEAQEEIMQYMSDGYSWKRLSNSEKRQLIEASGKDQRYWKSYELLLKSGSAKQFTTDQLFDIMSNAEKFAKLGADQLYGWLSNTLGDTQMATDIFAIYYEVDPETGETTSKIDFDDED